VVIFLTQLFIGISSLIGGITTSVFGFQQLGNDQIPFFILIALILFGLGGFLLFKASRFGENMRFQSKEHTSGENVLLKNNQMLNEYIKSADKKDKMQTLKMIASAEEQASEQKKIGS